MVEVEGRWKKALEAGEEGRIVRALGVGEERERCWAPVQVEVEVEAQRGFLDWMVRVEGRGYCVLEEGAAGCWMRRTCRCIGRGRILRLLRRLSVWVVEAEEQMKQEVLHGR